MKSKTDEIIKAIRLADLENIKQIKVQMSDLVLLANEIESYKETLKKLDRELMIANSTLYKTLLEEPIPSLNTYA